MKKQKEVYLTIDDSPSTHMKEKVDFLVRKEIPAIFFCRGDLMEQRPNVVVYALRQGFVVGNHAYNHVPFSLIKTENAQRQIRKTDKILRDLYRKAGIPWTHKYFRFPYGNKGHGVAFFTRNGENHGPDYTQGYQKKNALQKTLKELGYEQPPFKGIQYPYYKTFDLDTDIDTYWTYDLEEYRLSIEEIIKRMNTTNDRQGGRLDTNTSRDILLIHDHEETHKVFIEILNILIQKKIIFLTSS